MIAFGRVVLAFPLALVLAPAALAAWGPDGVPVSTVGDSQRFPIAVTDDAGGAFVVWTHRAGAGQRLYIQRVTADGDVAAGWPLRGIALPSGVNGQAYPAATRDGAGGVIVAWLEARGPGPNVNVHAIRITPSGAFAPGWADTGVQLSDFASQKFSPAIVTDGSGGAIVVWGEFRQAGPSMDLHGQHVSAEGVVLWAVAGQPIVTASTYDEEPRLVADGAGGAIVVWGNRWAITNNPLKDFHALRITGAGTAHPGWPPGGIAISNQNPNYSYQVGAIAVTDGAGGAIVVWTGGDFVCGDAISATRVDRDGNVAWTGSRNVSGQGCNDFLPCAAADGLGGVIVAWADIRNYGVSSYDVYAQHLTSDGTVLWPASGLPVSRAMNAQYFPAIAADGNGGAFIAWRDSRDHLQTSQDIYGQHLLHDGSIAPGWLPDGSPVCTAIGVQDYVSIAASGTGRAIAAWDDTRASSAPDIYAGILVDASPVAVSPAPPGSPAPRLDGFRPNPADRVPNVTFELSEDGPATLELFDVSGRRVARRAVGRLGPGRHTVQPGGGARLNPGVYVIRLVQGERVLVARGVVTR